MRFYVQDIKRFWEKVDKQHPSKCWKWTGCISARYGLFWVFGRKYKAHRVSWMIENGAIPEGLWILHKCDNPPCVNPNHLFSGNRSENMLDAARKGRLNPIGHALITHCKYGHEFTNDNIYYRTKNAHRVCKKCDKAYKLKVKQRSTIRQTPTKEWV